MKVEKSNLVGKKAKCPYCGTVSLIEKNDFEKETGKNAILVFNVTCPECTLLFPILKVVPYICPSVMGLPPITGENDAYPIEMNRAK